MTHYRALLSDFEQVHQGALRMWLKRSWADRLQAAGIDQPWRLVPENAFSRGQGAEVVLDDRTCFIKQYFRGGWAGGILKDKYLWTGRFLRELAVCEALRGAQAPVPEVLALVMRRTGLFTRVYLVTAFVAGAVSLKAALPRDDPGRRNACLGKVGGALRLMHDQGIAHPDLNINNIVVTPQAAVMLLDFDGSRFSRCPAKKWWSLFRLHRSCLKRRLWHDGGTRLAGLEKEDIQAFLAGYLKPGESVPGLAAACFTGYGLWERAHSLFWKRP